VVTHCKDTGCKGSLDIDKPNYYSLCVAGVSRLSDKRLIMAKPIEATPVLKGKDARMFLSQMNSAIMTPERMQYLESVAAESKRAEKSTK